LKTYQIIIKPLTGFGTPLKGDTLFGHICWQIYYDKDLLGKDLETLLNDYITNPFCIVSSAYPYIDNKNNKKEPQIYLKKPTLPLHFLFSLPEEELVQKRKELKAKEYFLYKPPLPPLNQIEYLSSDDVIIVKDEQVRCTIHRLLGTTSRGGFTPFVVPKLWYITKLVLFVGVREDIPIEGIIEALRRIGKFGYGRDATAGWGKFEVLSYEEIDFYANTRQTENAYYALSPLIPDKSGNYAEIFYEPFIRFGRHGDVLSASPNPFKSPVLMADEGAILIPKKFEKRIYVGRAILGVSSIIEKAVHQGYSLVIPVEVSYDKIQNNH